MKTLDGIECLREAISTVPVPGAPPRLSRDGAAVGLAFLDAALRLNHVRRLTERLSLLEHRIARRTTEVDVSLSMLDRGQSAAAALFQQLVSHIPEDREPASIYDKTIWVPVARISRRTAEPIDVRDAAGNKVPRLTQYETSSLLVSGLYRLLRESLTSHPDSSNPDTDLNRMLFRIHEPRWLIQAALVTLFTDRDRPDTRMISTSTEGTVDGHGRQYRKMALSIFDSYASYLKDYSSLLDIALNDHLLVIALDATIDEHLLTYDTPLYVSKRAKPRQRIWRALRASGEGYYVQYHTSIPSTLRSYHLVFECASGVDIRPLYLSTDADARAVEALQSDLTQLALRLGEERQTPGGESAKKLLELEAQTTLRNLAEVVRRRRWEASHAGITLPEQDLWGCLQLTQAAVAGEATVGGDGKTGNSIVQHPNFSSDRLLAAAEELGDLGMSHDLSLQNDPVSTRAHAYWRHAQTQSVNAGQIHIRAGAILREPTGAGPRDALLYAITLAATAYLMASFLSSSAWPYWNVARISAHSIRDPEAVVAVLLVVPGFLYTRLTIPDPHSISGHLRAVPRIVVRACITSMLVASAAIAANNGVTLIRYGFAFAIVFPLLSAVLLFRREPYRLTKALGRMGGPRWAGRRRLRRGPMAPDVQFSAAGGSHE
jgi:uncharacterized small protein (DUF1192 family)